MNRRVKKRIQITIIILLSITAIYFIFYVLKNWEVKKEIIEISLEQMEDSGEYQFDTLEWGMSVDEVAARLPKDIVANHNDTIYDKITQYSPKNLYGLDGQSSKCFLQFNSGALQQVQLSFNINEGYKEWFQLRVDEAKRLFGEESDTLELIDGPGGINSLGYRWDTSETTLQIVVMWGKTDESSVIISVAKKEE